MRFSKHDAEKVLQDYAVLLEKSNRDYNYYFNKVNELDLATQDLLHQIELGEKTSTTKWAKQLMLIRQQRRYAKDMAMMLEPINAYYLENKKEVNRIQNLIGTIRKNEKYFNNRTYNPRVIKTLTI